MKTENNILWINRNDWSGWLKIRKPEFDVKTKISFVKELIQDEQN